MVGVGGQVEVVDGDVGALANVFEGDGATNSCGAACDGCGLGGEEVMGHGCCCEGAFEVVWEVVEGLKL